MRLARLASEVKTWKDMENGALRDSDEFRRQTRRVAKEDKVNGKV